MIVYVQREEAALKCSLQSAWAAGRATVWVSQPLGDVGPGVVLMPAAWYVRAVGLLCCLLYAWH